MMSEHTPGPWEWVERNQGDYWILLGANSKKVCSDGSAGGEYNQDIDPNSADGQLIAAAPDLLAACEIALQFCGEYPDVYDLVSDAIAKAKGATSE